MGVRCEKKKQPSLIQTAQLRTVTTIEDTRYSSAVCLFSHRAFPDCSNMLIAAHLHPLIDAASSTQPQLASNTNHSRVRAREERTQISLQPRLHQQHSNQTHLPDPIVWPASCAPLRLNARKVSQARSLCCFLYVSANSFTLFSCVFFSSPALSRGTK